MQAIEATDHILRIGRTPHTDQAVLLILVVPAGLLRHLLPITPHLLQVRLQEHQIQNLQVVNLQAAVVRLPQMEHHQLQLKRRPQQRLSVRNSIWAIEFSKKE